MPVSSTSAMYGPRPRCSPRRENPRNTSSRATSSTARAKKALCCSFRRGRRRLIQLLRQTAMPMDIVAVWPLVVSPVKVGVCQAICSLVLSPKTLSDVTLTRDRLETLAL